MATVRVPVNRDTEINVVSRFSYPLPFLIAPTIGRCNRTVIQHCVHRLDVGQHRRQVSPKRIVGMSTRKEVDLAVSYAASPQTSRMRAVLSAIDATQRQSDRNRKVTAPSVR